MGFNTIHRDGDCYLSGKNLTNLTTFRYKEITPKELERMNLSVTLSTSRVSLTIQVNGRCDININDKIELQSGRTLIVKSMSQTHDHRVLLKRKDMSRTTGSLVIALG